MAINLLGSGSSVAILRALPCQVLMERRAYREIRRHPIKDRMLAVELDAWRSEILLEVVSLSDQDRRVFDELTTKSLSTTLDDGEAATIAYAVTAPGNGVPVIDEKKATRLFRERWPGRHLINTPTLFRTLAESGLLPKETVQEAVYSALVHARMRVSHAMRPWVVDLIGPERAVRCPSLGWQPRAN